MPGSYVVGVNVGATNTKALLYDLEAGQVVAVASRPALVHHPQPARSKFQPEELWQGAAACLREVMACCPRRDAVARGRRGQHGRGGRAARRHWSAVLPG